MGLLKMRIRLPRIRIRLPKIKDPLVFLLLFIGGAGSVIGGLAGVLIYRENMKRPRIKIQYATTPVVKEWMVKSEIRNSSDKAAEEVRVRYESDKKFLDFVWYPPYKKLENKGIGGKGEDYFESSTIPSFSPSDEPIKADAILQGGSEYLQIRVRAKNLIKKTEKKVKLSQQLPELQDP